MLLTHGLYIEKQAGFSLETTSLHICDRKPKLRYIDKKGNKNFIVYIWSFLPDPAKSVWKQLHVCEHRLDNINY